MKRVYFANIQDAHLFACEKQAEGRFVEIIHQNAGQLWGEACGVSVVFSVGSADRIESDPMQKFRTPFQLPNVVSSAAWYFVCSGALLLGIMILAAAVLHPLTAVKAFLACISLGFLAFTTLAKYATTLQKLFRPSARATCKSRQRFRNTFRSAVVVLTMISIQFFCASDYDPYDSTRKSAFGALPGSQTSSYWDSWGNSDYREGIIAF